MILREKFQFFYAENIKMFKIGTFIYLFCVNFVQKLALKLSSGHSGLQFFGSGRAGPKALLVPGRVGPGQGPTQAYYLAVYKPIPLLNWGQHVPVVRSLFSAPAKDK